MLDNEAKPQEKPTFQSDFKRRLKAMNDLSIFRPRLRAALVIR